jgi:hypothetical protein
MRETGQVPNEHENKLWALPNKLNTKCVVGSIIEGACQQNPTESLASLWETLIFCLASESSENVYLV